MSHEEREKPGALVPAGSSRELVKKTNTIAKRGLELADALRTHQSTNRKTKAAIDEGTTWPTEEDTDTLLRNMG